MSNIALAFVVVGGAFIYAGLLYLGAAFIHWEFFTPDLGSWTTWRAVFAVTLFAAIGRKG